MKILRKNHKEMLEIKNSVTELRTGFDELISRPDIVEERKEPPSLRICQYKCPKLKSRERQKIEKENWNRIPRNSGTTTNV